jgi:pimeloyl-ACP methyl ester carboxylesterase
VAGSAAGLAAYAAGRIIVRGRTALPELHEQELLGAVRGRARSIRGPRTSSLYTEWFPVPKANANGGRRTSGRAGVTEQTGAIVLTHGWCVTEAIWHHQKEAFGNGPHTLVTWDLPGHGHSTPMAKGRLTLEIAVDALARVIDEVREPDVLLVGHSLGGVLTLGYLERHPDTARERVRGIVLASTPLMHHGASGKRRLPGARVRSELMALGMQLAVENSLVDGWFAREAGGSDERAASYRLIRTGFGPRPSPSQIRFVRDMAASVPPQVRADTFRAMRGFDLRSRLPQVNVPALVLAGAHDRLVAPEESRELAAMLPRAQMEELPDAGHAPFLESAEEFNRLVGRFAARRLRRNGAGAGGRKPLGRQLATSRRRGTA